MLFIINSITVQVYRIKLILAHNQTRGLNENETTNYWRQHYGCHPTVCCFPSNHHEASGTASKVGVTELGQEGLYNIRTPLLDENPISYKVTRFAPKNDDVALGEIDLTPTEQFVLIWECEEEPSAFDNQARECPHKKN